SSWRGPSRDALADAATERRGSAAPSGLARPARSDDGRVADDRRAPHDGVHLDRVRSRARRVPRCLLADRAGLSGADELREGDRTVSDAVRRPARLWDEAGQTTPEYLMIAGLLTAIIVQITQIVVPTLGNGVTRLLHHMVEYLTSPGK